MILFIRNLLFVMLVVSLFLKSSEIFAEDSQKRMIQTDLEPVLFNFPIVQAPGVQISCYFVWNSIAIGFSDGKSWVEATLMFL